MFCCSVGVVAMANVSATSPPPVATATSGSHDNGHKQKAASPHNVSCVKV